MRILAIGAHPDDVEVYCGGTLARYALRGDQAYVLTCTDGGLGHQVMPSEELIALRAREAQAAAGAMGARLLMLGEADGWLVAEAATRRKLREVFAEVQPDVVLTHPPADYHPDHRAASALAAETCALAQTVLLYMDTSKGLGFLPDFYVDLTGEAMARKLCAVACHRSQLDWLQHHDGIDLLEWVRGAAHTRGLECGVPYAEAFRLAPGWGMLKAAALLP
jgi:LmbE family N-acetylglucosaminyl deacetylase